MSRSIDEYIRIQSFSDPKFVELLIKNNEYEHIGKYLKYVPIRLYRCLEDKLLPEILEVIPSYKISYDQYLKIDNPKYAKKEFLQSALRNKHYDVYYKIVEYNKNNGIKIDVLLEDYDVYKIKCEPITASIKIFTECLKRQDYSNAVQILNHFETIGKKIPEECFVRNLRDDLIIRLSKHITPDFPVKLATNKIWIKKLLSLDPEIKTSYQQFKLHGDISKVDPNEFERVGQKLLFPFYLESKLDKRVFNFIKDSNSFDKLPLDYQDIQENVFRLLLKENKKDLIQIQAGYLTKFVESDQDIYYNLNPQVAESLNFEDKLKCRYIPNIYEYYDLNKKLVDQLNTNQLKTIMDNLVDVLKRSYIYTDDQGDFKHKRKILNWYKLLNILKLIIHKYGPIPLVGKYDTHLVKVRNALSNI